jgi:hypothetical protein
MGRVLTPRPPSLRRSRTLAPHRALIRGWPAAVTLLLELGVLCVDLVSLTRAHKSLGPLRVEHGGFELMTHPMLEPLVAAHTIDPLRQPARDAETSA